MLTFVLIAPLLHGLVIVDGPPPRLRRLLREIGPLFQQAFPMWNGESQKVEIRGGFHKWGTPKNGWFTHEKEDDLGVPLFQETPKWRMLLYYITDKMS